MNFVTGSTGFLGAHLLYHLIRRGEEVVALKRPSSNLEYIRQVFQTYDPEADKLLNKVNWVNGDVLDYQELLNIDYPIERIYHLAAMVSFDPSDKKRLLQTNVWGTSNIVNFALEKQISDIVFVSSVAALDPVNENQRITEDKFGNNPERKSTYAQSKFQSELEIWRGIEEGLRAVIVNPSVIIGPGMKNEGPAKVFRSVKNGLRFYPQGTTGFVDVRDTCRVIMELVSNECFNERYIVNEGNYSYKKLFRIIASIYGKQPPNKELKPFITNLFYRLDWLKTFLARTKRIITKELHRSMHGKSKFSNEKVKQQLKYEFIPIEESVRDTITHLIE